MLVNGELLTYFFLSNNKINSFSLASFNNFLKLQVYFGRCFFTGVNSLLSTSYRVFVASVSLV